MEDLKRQHAIWDALEAELGNSAWKRVGSWRTRRTSGTWTSRSSRGDHATSHAGWRQRDSAASSLGDLRGPVTEWAATGSGSYHVGQHPPGQRFAFPFPPFRAARQGRRGFKAKP